MKSKKVIFGAVALVFVTVAVLFGGGKWFNLGSSFLNGNWVDLSTLSWEELERALTELSPDERSRYIAELNTELSDNRTELTSIEGKISTLETDISTSTAQVDPLESEISALEVSYSEAESDYQVKSAGLERLKANLEAQSKTVATQEALLAEVESILANQINQKSIYESQITAANQQVTTLKAQSDALASTLAGIPDRINQAQGSLNRIDNDIVGAERARDQAQSQVTYLQDQKTIYTTDIAKLTSEIKQLNTDLTKLNADLAKYQAEKTKLQQQGKSTTAITTQINTTNTKINTVKGQISTKQKNKTTKEGYLKNINLQIPSADTRLKQAKASLIPLQATKTTHTNTLASLNKERTTVTGQKLVKDSELAAARISLNNLNSSQASLTGGIANSEKDKETKQKKLSEAQILLKSAQEDFDAENAKLKPAQEALKGQSDEIKSKQRALEEIQQDIQVATRKLENAREQKIELEQKAVEIQKNITMASNIVQISIENTTNTDNTTNVTNTGTDTSTVTTDPNLGNTSSVGGLGQTFKAETTGKLDSITLQTSTETENVGSGILYLCPGEATTTTECMNTPTHYQTVDIPTTLGTVFTININTLFPVTSGATYTFVLVTSGADTTNLRLYATASYNDGNILYSSGLGTEDLVFDINAVSEGVPYSLAGNRGSISTLNAPSGWSGMGMSMITATVTSDITFTTSTTGETGLDGTTGTTGWSSGTWWVEGKDGRACEDFTTDSVGIIPDCSCKSGFDEKTFNGKKICLCPDGTDRMIENGEGVCRKKIDCSGIPNSEFNTDFNHALPMSATNATCKCKSNFVIDSSAASAGIAACVCPMGMEIAEVNWEKTCVSKENYDIHVCNSMATVRGIMVTGMAVEGGNNPYRYSVVPACNKTLANISETFHKKFDDGEYYSMWTCPNQHPGYICRAKCDIMPESIEIPNTVKEQYPGIIRGMYCGGAEEVSEKELDFR